MFTWHTSWKPWPPSSRRWWNPRGESDQGKVNSLTFYFPSAGDDVTACNHVDGACQGGLSEGVSPAVRRQDVWRQDGAGVCCRGGIRGVLRKRVIKTFFFVYHFRYVPNHFFYMFNQLIPLIYSTRKPFHQSNLQLCSVDFHLPTWNLELFDWIQPYFHICNLSNMDLNLLHQILSMVFPCDRDFLNC